MDQSTIAACRALALTYKIPVATLLGVVDQESAGVITNPVKVGNPSFDGDEPTVRFEGHYFYKRLTGAKLKMAVDQGLASPKVGGIANPSKQSDRWGKLILPAMKIDRAAAIESVSWGVGQVMGANWKAIGCASADEFMSTARSGITGQIKLMMDYCVHFDLIDELQRGDFRGFARGYNGAGAVGSYSDSLAKKVAAWKVAYADAPVGEAIKADAQLKETMIKMGANGALVRTAQELLTRAGFTVTVDGDFGPATKEAMKGFQKAKGIDPVDGVVGPKTWTGLDAYRVDPTERPGVPGPAEAVVVTPEGRQGAVTAGGGISVAAAIATAKTELLPVIGTSDLANHIYTYLSIGAVAVIIGGIAWTGVGWYRANRTHGVKHP